MAQNIIKEKKAVKIVLDSNSKLSPEIITALEDLFDFVPPHKLSIKLRSILLTYLRHEREMLPLDVDQTIMELQLLMEFLDSIGEEQSINNKKP